MLSGIGGLPPALWRHGELVSKLLERKLIGHSGSAGLEIFLLQILNVVSLDRILKTKD